MSDDFNALRRSDKDLNGMIESLIDTIGLQLLNLVLGTKKGQVSGWTKGKGSPSEQQRKLIASLFDVVSVLSSHISEGETKLWLVSHSDYIYGIPAKEIKARPEDVRLAALNRVSRGEDYEIFGRM